MTTETIQEPNTSPAAIDQPTTALTVVAKLTPPQIFGPGALDPLIERIKAHVRSIKTDISTEEGRKALRSLVRKIASSKVFIDDQGAALVADKRAEIGAVDAERRRAKGELEALQEEVRRPLTEWEASELSRKDEHEAMIKAMLDVVGTRFTSVEQVEKARAVVDQVWDRKFDEFLQRATEAHEYALIHLNNEIRRITDEAAAKAEQARLKAERDEQARKDREAIVAEEARLKAEADAKRRADAIAAQTKQREEELERTAAEEKARLQREIDDAKERVAQAERDRVAAEKQAEKDRDAARLKAAHDRETERKRAEDEREQAVQAERKRNDDIRKAEEDKKVEAERLRLAREADVEHRREIHKKAYDALLLNVAELTSPQARNIVQAIAKGFIPGVSIQY